MKLHTAHSWEEMFHRIMQSWADTATWIGQDDPQSANEPDHCFDDSCARDDLLKLAMAADQTVPHWSHWMAHELSYLLLQLKLAIQDQARNRPHRGRTVAHYFIGSGNVAPWDRSQGMKEAVEIMDLNTQTFYLWIQDRLLDLGDWPRKVYERAHMRSPM